MKTQTGARSQNQTQAVGRLERAIERGIEQTKDMPTNESLFELAIRLANRINDANRRLAGLSALIAEDHQEGPADPTPSYNTLETVLADANYIMNELESRLAYLDFKIIPSAGK